MEIKGIILAGGTGSRLHPLTATVNKQLLPVYDKPAIYYPLTTLMLAGIREIMIVSTPADLTAMKTLLKDGRHFGLSLHYQTQDRPRGLPDGLIIAEKFIGGNPAAMVLGDNFFYGQGFSALLAKSAGNAETCHVFLYSVKDPSRYGIAKFDADGRMIDMIEKPEKFVSPWAITGLYFFPADAAQRAKKLKPSKRGELEITDLIRLYMGEGAVDAHKLGRGNVWFDVGTPDSLLMASNFVEVIQNRQNILIASPEEIAWRMKFIGDNDYRNLIGAMPICAYRNSLEATLTA